MVIITDTREQKPISNQKFQKLLVGDYSTEFLQDKFCIERKSPQDLCQTIARRKNHITFRKELLRAEENDIELPIYVECTAKQFFNKEFPGGPQRKISGETLEKIIKTMTLRYNLEFVWCKDRSDLREKIIKRLKSEERKWKKKLKEKR